MNQSSTPKPFGKDHAASYDQARARLAPLKDALHLCLRSLFADLPNDSRVLCVGAGTGAELVYLAQEFPQWSFTVVEPAAAMMKVCRENAETSRIVSRCTFHEGYLDSLPQTDLFHAATSILVSQFILVPDNRRKFLTDIAARLRPGGGLVTADLASDMSSQEYQTLVAAWVAMHLHAGISLNPAYLGRDVAVVPPQEMDPLLASAGFPNPVRFFQTLLIHAWYARTNANNQ